MGSVLCPDPAAERTEPRDPPLSRGTSDLSSSIVDATHGLGVGAESVANDRVLDQELLHSDDGDAVAIAAVDEDAAQSDAPRGVLRSSLLLRFARKPAREPARTM